MRRATLLVCCAVFLVTMGIRRCAMMEFNWNGVDPLTPFQHKLTYIALILAIIGIVLTLGLPKSPPPEGGERDIGPT
jgi:hypothetical protein